MNRWLIVMLLALLGLARAADAPSIAADPALEARVNALAAELRCLVCQNQTIADSNADLAIDLKNQVREQLKAGRSETDVVAYMTQRYGDFVLYRPPFKASTVLLWAGPALLVLIGLALFWRSLRRSQSAPVAAAMNDADAARAAQLLAADDTPRG
ncbi:MAG: cytochrome c-type biogenesis protein CcmH [Rubrivivax sp.]|nr:cytochrome c-type biogenesis protein CcmH [Rubrivivax sp.]MBK7264283.1 cytochrome c-type biogenesis protein CcmH [Rubrivivax sp.]MBK8527793.1 cytochrome c-type biogenesis protein CcmH [Rubrivivax sp.]